MTNRKRMFVFVVIPALIVAILFGIVALIPDHSPTAQELIERG